MRIRLLTGAALAMAVASVMPSAAGGGVAYTVTPNPAEPGDVLTLAGNGCTKEDVLASLEDGAENSIAQGQTESDLDGSWMLQMTVPADTEPGDYFTFVTCNDPNAPFTLGSVTVQIGGEPEPEPEPKPQPEPAPVAQPTRAAPTLAG